jgi:glycosyltransferase involved in cell wall biosynthesis
MKILIANDGLNDAGGVQVYLDAVVEALRARGHSLAVAHCEASRPEGLSAVWRDVPRFQLAGPGGAEQSAALQEWSPHLCYSHNMDYVDVDATLTGIAPVVKFMHGYFGTCIGGQKMHAFPSPAPCNRVYGPACAALYLPCRCGRMSPSALIAGRRTAEAHRALHNKYAAVVVASEHMRSEYVRNGVDAARVHVNQLFPTHRLRADRSLPGDPHVAFLGRMTRLKGGDLLIRAVHRAASRLSRPIRLTMIGDGPQRLEWEALADRLGVACTFTGWVEGDARWALVRAASIVAVPSVWPEPFGLVGLEAGALGVPAVAADVGGIGEWLHDGVNGVVVPAPASPESFGDALASLLADGTRLLALGAGARKVAMEMTLDGHVDRLESIFETVVAGRC